MRKIICWLASTLMCIDVAAQGVQLHLLFLNQLDQTAYATIAEKEARVDPGRQMSLMVVSSDAQLPVRMRLSNGNIFQCHNKLKPGKYMGDILRVTFVSLKNGELTCSCVGSAC